MRKLSSKTFSQNILTFLFIITNYKDLDKTYPQIEQNMLKYPTQDQEQANLYTNFNKN